MKRKYFLQQLGLGASGLIAAPFFLNGQANGIPTKPPKLEPLPAEKVKEFVGAGHNNLAKVKELLLEFPTLLYATWDWGGGDFETAIEGAGHVGNKEIANYLVSQGARANMFVLTMLGKTQVVKPYLEAFPEYLKARGPHGYTFIHHAQRGGEEAKELLDYFQSKGLTEARVAL